MTKTIRIFATLIIFALMLSMSCINVFAGNIATENIDFQTAANEIMPLWTNIDVCSLGITYNNGIGNATGTVTKQSGVTSIEGTVEVYEKVNGRWVYIDSWYKSTTRYSLAVSADFDATQGTEYKAVFTIYAYRGTTVETHTMESIKTYS